MQEQNVLFVMCHKDRLATRGDESGFLVTGALEP